MKVVLQIVKYGEFLSSRPEGREAALAAWAYHENLRDSSKIELDFTDVLVLTPSWLSEFVLTLRAYGSLQISYGHHGNLSVQQSVKTVIEDTEKSKVHPWRLCPAGEHAVKTHPLRTPPSESHPDGGLTSRHIHCARNPSGKDQLYPLEIKEIAAAHFSGVSKRPCPKTLSFSNGSKFDESISGWVQYWNDVLHADDPLDPDLVKALIASESGFEPNRLNKKADSNSARGLMQITNDTRKILADESGELKNHFVTATKAELNDPDVNVCAGVRWLFRKKDLASLRLKRAATWIEAAEEYKGDLKGILGKKAGAQGEVNTFLRYLEKVQRCE